jgi:serine O-acetyltransferase
MRITELIRSDLYRYYGNTGMKSFLKGWMLNRGFNYMLWFRLAGADIPLVSRLAGIVLRLKQNSYGIQILRGTEIGPGLYIGHGGPCIIHPSTRIGSNVNLSQFVTIGSNDGKAATIGDNVYIGPNAVLVEDIVIGNNVTIGAGAVVTHSIPENATAAGNPARVLNQKSPGRYVNKRWPTKPE